MQVGFLPFIPSPVTDYGTVYTAMKNVMNVSIQLRFFHYFVMKELWVKLGTGNTSRFIPLHLIAWPTINIRPHIFNHGLL